MRSKTPIMISEDTFGQDRDVESIHAKECHERNGYEL